MFNGRLRYRGFLTGSIIIFKAKNIQKSKFSQRYYIYEGGNTYDNKKTPEGHLYHSAMRCGDNRDNGQGAKSLMK